jgi:hypothetical protein
MQIAKISCFQKSAYYAGIKLFNNLLSSLKILFNEEEQFKAVLKWYLNAHSFYSADEFLPSQNDS